MTRRVGGPATTLPEGVYEHLIVGPWAFGDVVRAPDKIGRITLGTSR